MRLQSTCGLVIALGAVTSTALGHSKRSYTTHDYYVLEHDSSASASHWEVADALGAEVVEQVGELKDHWLLRIPKHANSQSKHHSKRVLSATRSLTPQIPRQRAKRQLVERQSQEEERPRLKHFESALDLHDPEFHTQWHLLNEKTPPHDMNVTGVWEMGYTGKGVISAIVDDGLDFHSDDLADNYVCMTIIYLISVYLTPFFSGQLDLTIIMITSRILCLV